MVLFHSRSRWPEKVYNGNVFSDVRAARALLQLTTLPIVLFDTGTYLRQPMEEAKRLIAPTRRWVAIWWISGVAAGAGGRRTRASSTSATSHSSWTRPWPSGRKFPSLR